MIKKIQKNDGFTLIELLVTIVTGSIITMAASTVLILGLRIYHRSMDTAERQSVMRITTSLLEALSSDGKISVDDPEEWEIKEVTRVSGGGTSERTLISYSKDFAAIYPGEVPEYAENKNPIVEDVTESSVEKGATILREEEAALLPLYRFKVKLQSEEYETSVYCRIQETDWYAYDPDLDAEAGRKAFLKELASQTGSFGNVLYRTETESQTRELYSRWYTTKKGLSQWPDSTPWCGCYVAWAMDRCSSYLSTIPLQADVNKMWVRHYFDNNKSMDGFKINYPVGVNYPEGMNVPEEGIYNVPTSGDLIFFERDKNEDNKYHHLGYLTNLTGLTEELLEIIEDFEDSDILTFPEALGCEGDGFDHVGVVVSVETIGAQQFVYTIEGNVGDLDEYGNVTNGRVRIRKYSIEDPTIRGYLVLNWK